MSFERKPTLPLEQECSSISKTPVKWFQVPIQKFNTAVPHFVDLLKYHCDNIRKFKRLNQNEDIKKSNIDASRTAHQLISLLNEMDSLRCQVVGEEVAKFDKLISNSKQCALFAIQTHQDLSSKICLGNSTENTNVKFSKITKSDVQQEQLQIVTDLSEDLKNQEQQLASMEKIEDDVKEMQSLFEDLSQLVEHQGEKVDHVENHVEEAHQNVLEGEGMLAQAARYKHGVYPLIGALVGSVLGGPVGVLAGFKMGGLTATALGCGFLGFTGGRMLKSQGEIHMEEADNYRKELANSQF